ncbi:MAG: SUMF1/EgtB/PvdO family nonheme iron enzyme [Blastocatellia bacterium]|nr:SUMF1/EgtB/PvdO family nonheme iron enzyme [Blastocatellia bacterium]
MLSESEVVERMYANGEDGSITPRKSELSDFFSESKIVAHQQAALSNLAHQEMPSLGTSSEVADEEPEFPAISDELQVQPTASAIDAAPENGTPPVKVQALSALPALESSLPLASPIVPPTREAQQTVITAPLTTPTIAAPPDGKTEAPDSAKIGATITEPITAKPNSPVQTVRVLNRPRTPTPPIDKKLIKIIVVLILLILLFSALIVSGFRIRDLFGKPNAQATTNVITPLMPASPPAQIPETPEGMVYIPGGTFRMGVDEGDSYESPAHEVTIPAFFMDRTEVTNAQYADFVKATNHAPPPEWKDGQAPPATDKLPVVNVSWQDAIDYATWAGKRLPTEAEWEYAAKANDNRRYPWGPNWDATKANTGESNLNHPIEADSYTKAANPLGLLNMAGNVWEWVAGEVTSYKDANLILAPGKVIRGGAFYAPKERATTTYRGFAPPDKQAAGIGFRCVKDAS